MASQPVVIADERDLGDYTEAGEFYMLLNLRQATNLAEGYVPNSVKAMAIDMLTFDEQVAAAAARPVAKKRTRA